MKLFDLSHPLHNNMPVYPGDKQPEITTVATHEGQNYQAMRFRLSTHTGTHVDAPFHMINDGLSLDKMPIDTFAGSAIIIDIPEEVTEISCEYFLGATTKLPEIDFLLLKTGWGNLWGTPEYFSNYPVLTIDAAKWLSRFPLKGVGFDTISADKHDSADFPAHKILLCNNFLIIENIFFPEGLPTNKIIDFYCLPLNIKDADGSPVRAVATLRK